MIYPSKRDLWIVLVVFPVAVLLVCAGIALLILAATRAIPGAVMVPGVALSLVGGCILWAMHSSSYEINRSELIVRSGPVRLPIRLESITHVTPRTGIPPEAALGLAWSMDRVVIRYRRSNGKMAAFGVAISPVDKDCFLGELVEAIVLARDVSHDVR